MGGTLQGAEGMKCAGCILGGGKFLPTALRESTAVPSSELGVESGAVCCQPTVSLDPRPTNPALSGAGMGIVSIRPEAAAVSAPALRNRHQGSGQFWEEALVNHRVAMQVRPGPEPRARVAVPRRRRAWRGG